MKPPHWIRRFMEDQDDRAEARDVLETHHFHGPLPEQPTTEDLIDAFQFGRLIGTQEGKRRDHP